MRRYKTAAADTGVIRGEPVSLETKMLGWLLAAASFVIFSFSGAAFAQDDGKRRLALLIGNGAYDAMAPLDHATSDARDLATLLEPLGFEVSLLINSDSATFSSAIASFTHRAKNADTALFYFAGHGFQFSGSNYLVPVDARLADPASALQEAANLEETLAQIAGAADRTIFLLDAGQDIPLPPGIQGQALRGLSAPGALPETFVAFASQPGSLTNGAESDTNPFTNALREHIPTKGQTISAMIAEIQEMVSRQTGGSQMPWTQSTLSEPFFFAPFRPKAEDIAKIAALPEAQRAFLLNIWRSQGADISREGLDARIVAATAPAKPNPIPKETEEQLTEAVPEALLERVILSMTPVKLTPRKDNRRRLVGRDITDLARALQVELARVGCYRSGIDGTWGGGSRRALQRFIDETEETRIKTLDPSVVTLDILLETEGTVCEVTAVRRAPANQAAPASSPPAATSAPAASAPATSSETAPAPAAPAGRLGKSLGNAFR